ncbi:MAG TPA: hypothetical protein VG389_24275 [Myxococcota bacterium]|jgi:TolA-binding protein|nr:hypothetical protein [Myxococcota bacterium]
MTRRRAPVVPLAPLVTVLLACGAALASAGATGCAAGAHGLGTPAPLPPGWDRAGSAVLEMEPLRIDLTKVGEGYEASFGEAAPLFDEANALVAAGDLAGAAVAYDKVAELYEDSRYALAARYDAGLMHEALGHFAEAAERYEKAARMAPGTPDAADALFRLGHCLGRLEKWERVRDVYREVLEVYELNASDSIEARTRLGVALTELGSVAEAEAELSAVLALRKDIERIERLDSPYFWAQAQFYLGEVWRLRTDAVPLDAAGKKALERDLEARARLLLVARRAYLDTVEIHNLYWATAAGMRLGQLLEDYRRAILEAPLPPELDTPEKVESYRRLLSDELDPAVYKAIAVYRSALEMAARTGARSKWVEETVVRLEALVGHARAEGWLAFPAGDAAAGSKVVEVGITNDTGATIVVSLVGYVRDRAGAVTKVAPSVEVPPGAEKVVSLREARYDFDVAWVDPAAGAAAATAGAPGASAGAGAAAAAAAADPKGGPPDPKSAKGAKAAKPPKGAKPGKGGKGAKGGAGDGAGAAVADAPATFTGAQSLHVGFVYKARIVPTTDGKGTVRPAPHLEGAPVLPDVAPGSAPALSRAAPAGSVHG